MRIGVDLGGTKIEAIAIDESGNELWRRRVATPVENYDEILGAIRNLVLAAENELSQKCAVGIGSPGAISPSSGLIRNSNSTVLNGRPLDRDLSECLGDRSVLRTMRTALPYQRRPTVPPVQDELCLARYWGQELEEEL